MSIEEMEFYISKQSSYLPEYVETPVQGKMSNGHDINTQIHPDAVHGANLANQAGIEVFTKDPKTDIPELESHTIVPFTTMLSHIGNKITPFFQSILPKSFTQAQGESKRKDSEPKTRDTSSKEFNTKHAEQEIKKKRDALPQRPLLQSPQSEGLSAPPAPINFEEAEREISESSKKGVTRLLHFDEKVFSQVDRAKAFLTSNMNYGPLSEKQLDSTMTLEPNLQSFKGMYQFFRDFKSGVGFLEGEPLNDPNKSIIDSLNTLKSSFPSEQAFDNLSVLLTQPVLGDCNEYFSQKGFVFSNLSRIHYHIHQQDNFLNLTIEVVCAIKKDFFDPEPQYFILKKEIQISLDDLQKDWKNQPGDIPSLTVTDRFTHPHSTIDDALKEYKQSAPNNNSIAFNTHY